MAVGYLRVSTTEQQLGPEAQRAAIEAWARRSSIEVVAWHEDHVSGGAPLDERPGLVAALEDVRQHGAGLLVAARRDRVARDVVLAAMIERAAERIGAEVVTVDGVGAGEGPEAELLRRIVDAVAAYERAVIRARTKGALQAKRRRGQRAGTVPYGYRLDPDDPEGQRLLEHEGEQQVLRDIERMHEARMGVRRIADELTRRGPAAFPRGSRWHATTVQNLVTRGRDR